MPANLCGCREVLFDHCYTCDNCRSTHCICVVCPSCTDRYISGSLCNQCGRCNEGCCGCVCCGEPQCSIRRASYRDFCDQCGRCETHCRCYLCNTCNVRLPANQRNTSELRRQNWCGNCNNCTAHCLCYGCSPSNYRNCSHRGNRSSVCSSCMRCPNHCSCGNCIICESRVSNLHSCGSCERCCSCNAQGVKFRGGKFTFHNAVFSKGQFKRNKLRRHLAVEIEVDKYTSGASSSEVNKAINTYRDPVVRDGSIGDSGFEITTNPSNGDLFLDHVKGITDGLTKIDARCSNSCGLHVHVNVKGDLLVDKNNKPILDSNGKFTFDKRTAYSQYDLHRLTKLYALVEQAMFALCNERRITSRYSIVCGEYWCAKKMDHKKFRQELIDKMYFEGKNVINRSKEHVQDHYGSYRSMGDHIKGKKSHKYENTRYKALNIHSYFMRGTIEFRHHEGTVNYEDITNWSLICGNIVDAASRFTDTQIDNLPRNSFDAMLAILPKNLREYCNKKWELFNSTQYRRYKMIMEDKFAGTEQVPANPTIPNISNDMVVPTFAEYINSIPADERQSLILMHSEYTRRYGR